jgi:hypothetical protein
MKKTNRVALYFATYTDNELNSFAILAIVCLKTNPLFPNLPLTIAALTALQTAFANAITGAAQGGTVATALKVEAREALIPPLRQIAAYIQSLGLSVSGRHSELWLAEPSYSKPQLERKLQKLRC